MSLDDYDRALSDEIEKLEFKLKAEHSLQMLEQSVRSVPIAASDNLTKSSGLICGVKRRLTPSQVTIKFSGLEGSRNPPDAHFHLHLMGLFWHLVQVTLHALFACLHCSCLSIIFVAG